MTKPELMPVVIERDRWLRACVPAARLRNSASGHQCCVGFICEAAGHTAKELGGAVDVTALHRQLDRIDERLTLLSWATNTPKERLQVVDPRAPEAGAIRSAAVIYHINDDSMLSDAEREAHVRTCGRSLGFDIRFRGRALPQPWTFESTKRLAKAMRERADTAVTERVDRLKVAWRIRRTRERRWRLAARESISAADAASRPRSVLLALQARAERLAAEHAAAVAVRIGGRNERPEVAWYTEPEPEKE